MKKKPGFWRILYIYRITGRMLKLVELLHSQDKYEEAEPTLEKVRQLLDEIEP